MPRHTPSCLSRIGTGSKSSNKDDAPAWQIGVLFGVGTPGHAAEIMASDAKETLRGRILNLPERLPIGFFWFRLVEPIAIKSLALAWLPGPGSPEVVLAMS